MTKISTGRGFGGGDGGSAADSVDPAQRKVKVEESRIAVETTRANTKHLKLMLQMKQEGLCIDRTKEEWAAALADCKVKNN